MRITLVSAHFPPNFISGGTLQPQRLARGLRARGHDVRVFAGYLDSELAPLTTWDELDETGLPVRWVVSTPWMGWSDPWNYDNPEVARCFAQHLADHPADVVHLHSLQTLGARLLPVARASGAGVVVTMHDFWWICARQFLVDQTSRPCSIVVAAGDCACEAGRAHLETRTAALRGHLAHADLILAPSAIAAEVLAANGIDQARLRVDENGMELGALGASATGVSARPGSPVVVRYTGGSNAMKGADVLVEAAHRLGGAAGLRIVAHGLEEAVRRDGRPLAGTPLEVRPPYEPDELDGILQDSDALVLPSVMRESHSLVTRESLLRGVPVVATDTLGPEEVVRDGVNGLIVPAGDAGLLASALARLVDGRLLDRLRSGAAHPPKVRSIDEQLDGLEQHYADLDRLPRGRPACPTSDRAPERVLFLVGIDGAPLRYRAQLPAEALALLGAHCDVRHYRDPDVEALADRADVIIVYRVPATRQVLALIERQRSRRIPVIFDVDDLIFDPDIAEEIPALHLLPAPEAALWLEGVRRYRTTMEACDAYIGSTRSLVEHARAVVGIDAHLFENGVGRVLGALSERALRRPRSPGPLRVGYFSGTTTHDDDWRHVEATVVEVLEQHPDAELWLGGHLKPSGSVLARLGPRVKRIPFTEWHELPEMLRDVDVNLAPLRPGSRFNDAKSAIKWLEAALAGTVTIASPSAPFREAIEPGVTGWLADGPREWRAALLAALDDPSVREAVASRARRSALLRWSPHLQGARYARILQSVVETVEARPRERQSAWVPEIKDEPLLDQPTPLAPYPPSRAPAGPTGSEAPRLRRQGRLGRLRRAVDEHGPARAAAMVVGRILDRSASRVRRR